MNGCTSGEPTWQPARIRFLLPLRRDLPHYAGTVGSTLRGGAVEIAVSVDQHAGDRQFAIADVEVVQVCVDPAIRGGRTV